MMRNRFIKFLNAGILFMGAGLSCTKLDTKVYDQVSDFWQTPDEISAGVGNVYVGLRDLESLPMYSLNEMSSDEILVPVRGGDWGDDVSWEQMWKHSWEPNHEHIRNGWQFVYGGIAKVNFILET